MVEDAQDPVAEIRRLAGPAKRIVFVSGNFNVVHPGHLRLLKFASECGDFLVVGVQDRAASGTLLPEELRLEGVRAIGLVDHAFVLREGLDAFLGRLKPHAVVKGKEFESRYNVEKSIVDSYGGKLLFGSGEVQFSSLDLLQREYLEVDLSTITKPPEFPRRHGFDMASLANLLRRMRGQRVVVVGDLIVDEYINCEPLGMSQEDPTIVVSPIETHRFVGGAGIVAAHARGLGANVTYLSVAGEGEALRYAEQQLEEDGVKVHIHRDESRPTTLKQRYRADGKTMLRVSHLRQHDISNELTAKLAADIERMAADAELVIFSDFNYGCLPQALVDRVTAFCAARGVRMVADSQSSSQVGDVSRFRGMQLLTPTEREARLALRDFGSGLVTVAQALAEKAQAQNIIVTLGAEGLLIHTRIEDAPHWYTDQLPAFNKSPKDSAGAGDSFTTTSSLALVAGASIWEAAYLGSIAAACQVGRVGNVPLTPKELEDEIAAG